MLSQTLSDASCLKHPCLNYKSEYLRNLLISNLFIQGDTPLTIRLVEFEMQPIIYFHRTL